MSESSWSACYIVAFYICPSLNVGVISIQVASGTISTLKGDEVHFRDINDFNRKFSGILADLKRYGRPFVRAQTP